MVLIVLVGRRLGVFFPRIPQGEPVTCSKSNSTVNDSITTTTIGRDYALLWCS